MQPTDTIRRFYVREFDQPYHPDRGGARRGFEIVDRTGFLPVTQFETGSGLSRNAQERAVEIASARNRCELAGKHTFEGDSTECSICDATTKADVAR